MEIWKDIIGYEGLYKISNFGNVKSIKKNRLLTNQINRYGYVYVSICKNGNKKNITIHKLVMSSFIGLSDKCINHIDGNKLNNTIHNLEYVTYKENTKHALENNLIKSGDDSVLTKISDKNTLSLYNDHITGFYTHKQLSIKYGISKTQVWRIVNKKSRSKLLCCI